MAKINAKVVRGGFYLSKNGNLHRSSGGSKYGYSSSATARTKVEAGILFEGNSLDEIDEVVSGSKGKLFGLNPKHYLSKRSNGEYRVHRSNKSNRQSVGSTPYLFITDKDTATKLSRRLKIGKYVSSAAAKSTTKKRTKKTVVKTKSVVYAKGKKATSKSKAVKPATKKTTSKVASKSKAKPAKKSSSTTKSSTAKKSTSKKK